MMIAYAVAESAPPPPLLLSSSSFVLGLVVFVVVVVVVGDTAAGAAEGAGVGVTCEADTDPTSSVKPAPPLTPAATPAEKLGAVSAASTVVAKAVAVEAPAACAVVATMVKETVHV